MPLDSIRFARHRVPNDGHHRQVVGVPIDDRIIIEDRIDVELIQPISRLG